MGIDKIIEDDIEQTVQNAILLIDEMNRRYGSMSAATKEADKIANQEVSCRCGFVKGKFRKVRFTICNQCGTAPSIFEPGTELYSMAQRQAREVSKF